MVIVSFFNRASREAYEFIELASLCKENCVELVSLEEGMNITEMSPIQVAVAGIQVELEWEQRKKATRRGIEAKLVEGKYPFSRPPFGYSVDKSGFLQMIKSEAEIVKEIYEQFIHLESIPKVVSTINEKFGECVTIQKATGILNTKTYTGIIHRNRYRKKPEGGREVYSYQEPVTTVRHEEIIPLELYEKAQSILNKSRKQNPNNANFLKGILLCPQCQNKMVMQYNRNAYWCNSQNTKCIKLEMDIVQKKVLNYLIEKSKEDLEKRHKDSKYLNSVEEIKSQLKEYAIKYATGKIKKETFQLKNDELNLKLKSLYKETVTVK